MSAPGAFCRNQRPVRPDDPVDGRHQLVLDDRVDHAVQRFQRGPALGRSRHLARDPVGAGDVRRLRPGLGDRPGDERDALRVDDVLGDDRRDQLAAQRMLGHEVPEPLDDGGREVAAEIALEVGVVGEVRAQDRGLQAELGVGEQHGELGTGHARAGALALRHLLARGQLLDRRGRAALPPRAPPSGPRSRGSASPRRPPPATGSAPAGSCRTARAVRRPRRPPRAARRAACASGRRALPRSRAGS